MRILCLNPYLPPPLGGIEKEMLAVAAELVALGHEVTLLASTARFPRGENPAAEGIPAGVTALRLPGRLRGDLRGFAPARAPLSIPGLRAAALAARPELTLAFNIGWGPPLRPVLRALRPLGPILYRTFFHPPGGILARLKTNYLLGTVALAHRAFVSTEREREQILAAGRIPPARLAVIPPGVSLHPPDPERVARLAREHDLLGRTVIAHVARLSRFKGTPQLLAVLPRVRQRTGQDVVLLLLGADDPQEPIAAQARRAGVLEHVRAPGEIRDDRTLRALLASAQVMALPSEYEAYGIAYLEALAEGLPCIGVDVGGVREAIAGHGILLPRFGDLAALEAALVELLCDEPRRKALGEAGRARVLGSLTWRHTTERILALAQREGA